MIDYTEGKGIQYHIGINADDLGKYVILPGDPGRCEKIAAYFDNPRFVGRNREFETWSGELLGEKVSVCSTGIGGPSASIALEELANLGAHTFIRIGTCGGIREDIVGGDIVIANAAIRMEGTSKEYAPIEFPAVADLDVTLALREGAKRAGQRAHIGVSQCKDAFYGQHQPELMPAGYELIQKWDAWVRMGTLCSEMETSTLYIVGQYRRVRVGAAFCVAANQEREKKGLSNKQCHDLDGVIRTGIEALKVLIEQDRNAK